MNYKTDFNRTLTMGQIGEGMMSNYFINYINHRKESLDHKYHITEYSSIKDWDFKALAYNVDEEGKSCIFPNEEKQKLMVEVKTDKYEKRTNNLFIELKSRGKKSGILTTTSNWFIYFFIRKNLFPKNNVFIFKTEDLREIVKKETINNMNLTYGGDNNTSLGCLLSINKLQEEYSEKFIVETYNNYELKFNEMREIVGWNQIVEKKIGFEF